ncbi:LysR substrate-binding domain-containing protein, partial [Escherichia coli]|nr:LysR substrate-binding domain-containing protein [Escherichia coli]
ATAKSLTLEELTHFPLVMRERGSKTRQKLQERAASMGFDLKPAIEAEGREAVREIVASGAGVGFVSSAEFGKDNRLVQIPIAGPDVLMDEALICLRERSAGKLVRVFLDIAKSLDRQPKRLPVPSRYRPSPGQTLDHRDCAYALSPGKVRPPDRSRSCRFR